MTSARRPLTNWRKLPRQLILFALAQVRSCVFPIIVFVALAASAVLGKIADMPLARYDALFLAMVIIQVLLVAAKIETWREAGVICVFHLLGLGLEIFKVQVGSWSYPGDAAWRLGGVPIFSGFMYASVGSYICQAFRVFDLRVTRFSWVPVTLLAVAAYANFFTHHWIWDLRVIIAVGFLVALARSRIFFTVGTERYWMPSALAFVLIGFFLWIAENAATLLGAWRYPNQEQAWQMVHVGKVGSWALLITLSFVLVAAVKAQEGTLYGDGGPRVTRGD